MPQKWWLVSDEALRIVREALEAAGDGDELAKRARHELACGTAVTDAVPADFRDGEGD